MTILSCLYNFRYALCGSATALYIAYHHRYECILQACVWYSTCKRRCNSKKTKKTDVLILDCRNDNVSPEQSRVMKLFPHICDIVFIPAIANKSTEKALQHAINNWTLCYVTGNKHNSVLPVRKVSLYAELETAFETLPDEIRITLDETLLGLLNIKSPVQSVAGNALYVLTKDNTQTIVMPC